MINVHGCNTNGNDWTARKYYVYRRVVCRLRTKNSQDWCQTMKRKSDCESNRLFGLLMTRLSCLQKKLSSIWSFRFNAKVFCCFRPKRTRRLSKAGWNRNRHRWSVKNFWRKERTRTARTATMCGAEKNVKLRTKSKLSCVFYQMVASIPVWSSMIEPHLTRKVLCLSMYLYVCSHTHIHTHTCMHAHTHIHMCAHAHSHARTHTCTCS